MRDYGFCLENNKYDSYQVKLNLKFENMDLNKMVDFSVPKNENFTPFRFKKDQLNCAVLESVANLLKLSKKKT